MTPADMSSTKPYLLRAIFEWAEDNGFTPQVLVNAEAPDVEVPRQHVVDGQIVLNISSSAVQLHVMDNDCLSFSARFSGVEQDIFLPIHSILAIFARENSQGIFFEELEEDEDGPEPTLSSVKTDSSDRKKSNKNDNGDDEPPKPSGKRPKKPKGGPHLKIIK